MEPKPTLLALLSEYWNWKDAPMADTLGKLGELKTAYEHFASIVLQRQEKSPPKLFCWVWEHRKYGYNGGAIPQSVVDQCRKIIPNGKWLFRDDGNMVRRHGVDVREPVVCCSARCSDMYSRWRNDEKARRMGAATSTQSGIEVR